MTFALKLREHLAAAALVGCAAASLSCGDRGGRPAEGPARAIEIDLDTGRVVQGRRVGLLFEIRGRAFPSPLVKAKVNDVPALFMVDTGANCHMLTGWFARKAGVSASAIPDKGTDHAGKTIETRLAEHVKIGILDWGELPEGPVPVVEVPDILERLGIGGFVSPQQLATDELSVVLDLDGGVMHVAKAGSEATLLPGRKLGDGAARACLDDASPLKNKSYVVRGTADGKAVDLLVDTGAGTTDILSSSGAGKALITRAGDTKDDVYAASGKVKPRTVKGVKVALGEVTTTLDVSLLPGEKDEFCPRDGVVGMDLLKHCTLIFGPRSMRGTCRETVQLDAKVTPTSAP